LSDLSFTKFRPEIQEFASGEQHISKSFGILTSVKLSNKSHDTELKVLKTCTTDLPIVTRLISLDKKRACIDSHTINALKQVVIEDKIKTFTEILLNSGRKFRALRDKNNKYFNSCVVRKKNSERNR
jgi:hypothetical protein